MQAPTNTTLDSGINKMINDVLGYHRGVENFVAERLEHMAFIQTIQHENFLPTLRAVLKDSSILDGDRMRPAAFKEIRREKIEQLEACCTALAANPEMLETQERLIKSITVNQAPENRHQLYSNLQANTERLVNEMQGATEKGYERY